MVFKIFGCLLIEKIKIKFLLASLKSLPNSENPAVTLSQEAGSSGFQVAACESKCWYLLQYRFVVCLYFKQTALVCTLYCTVGSIFDSKSHKECLSSDLPNPPRYLPSTLVCARLQHYTKKKKMRLITLAISTFCVSVVGFYNIWLTFCGET
jgi:hypothetical protein